MNDSAIPAAREAAVAAMIDRIRSIEVQNGGLDAILAELVGLAAQASLFPAIHFPAPPPGISGARRYVLSEDADHRFQLSLNATNPRTETVPHDHTTWVAIAAIEGQELNRIYALQDDEISLRLEHEVVVEPGHGLVLMPNNIHSIRILGNRPARHLHLYGVALEHLTERRTFAAALPTDEPT